MHCNVTVSVSIRSSIYGHWRKSNNYITKAAMSLFYKVHIQDTPCTYL